MLHFSQYMRFLVLNANAHMHSLNTHGQLPNGARYPNFDLHIYLHPFYVCESSEGFGDIAPKHIQ